MKIFIYKLSLVAIVIVIVFKLTIGSIISSVEEKITNLKSKNERIEIISSVKEEMIKDNKKDRIQILYGI